MPQEIVLPSLSAGMESGTLTRWLKRAGDAVSEREIIAEIETDKATIDLETPISGILGDIAFPDGAENIPVGSVLGTLYSSQSDYLNSRSHAVSAHHGPDVPPLPSQTNIAALLPEPRNADGAALAAHLRASPLARRLAHAHQLSLEQLHGSGPHGRIVRIDIERHLAARPVSVSAPAPSHPHTNATVAANDEGRRIPHSPMRKAIARRLSLSKSTVPHFYLRAQCIVDDMLELREQINASRMTDRISINDFMIRALACALAQTPQANVIWTETAMIASDRVDISVAVATEGGPITPIVRNADKKTLSAISSEVRSLAARARDGKLPPEEIEGGSASLSSLGMFGVSEFSAIINPPQSLILAVGAVERRPVCKDDAIVAASCVTCVLSVDHRVIDGALAGELLKKFRFALENPLALLV
jgi:pyruvate dehydrogenase E2 component (dihydrolipoamide acetyltransferase)